MDVKIATLKSGKVNLHLHSPFKISAGGFWHFAIITISIGKLGFGFHLLGFTIGIGWKE